MELQVAGVDDDAEQWLYGRYGVIHVNGDALVDQIDLHCTSCTMINELLAAVRERWALKDTTRVIAQVFAVAKKKQSKNRHSRASNY